MNKQKDFYLSMTNLFCTIVLIIFAQCLLAQTNPSNLDYSEIDSLMLLEYQQGNYKQAILILEKGREKARIENGKNDSIYSEYTLNLGLFYYMTNQIDKAESLYLEALDIREKIYGKEHILYANVLLNMGNFYADMYQFKKAEQIYLNAMDIYDKGGVKDSNEYNATEVGLASLYEDMGHFEKAEAIYLKNIKASKDSNSNYYATGSTLINLGSLYRKMGYYEKAEHFLYLAKEKLLTQSESHPQYIAVIGHLGGLFRDMGDYEKAETFFTQAINLDAKYSGKNDPYYAMSLSSLAGLYESMGLYRKAEPLYLEAKKINKNALGEDHPDYNMTLRRLTNVYLELKNYEKAETLGLEAKNITAKLYGEQDYRFALSAGNLGLIKYQKKDYPKAEKLLLQAHEIYTETVKEYVLLSITSSSDLSTLYLAMEDFDQALKYCLLSVHLNCKGIDSALDNFSAFDVKEFAKLNYKINNRLSISLEQLLVILEAQYNRTKDPKILDKHYSLAKVAMELNERFRNSLGGEKDKLRTSSNNTAFIRHGVKSALLKKGEVYEKEAFVFVERNKSALLLDAIKGNRARNLSDLPDSLIAQEIAYQKEYALLKKEQYEGNSSEDKSETTKKIGELQLEIDDFIKEIKQKYPKYHELKYVNVTAKTSDIQGLLDEETLFLEYFLTDSLIYLFAISKEEVTVYPINIDLPTLKQQIKALRLVLSDYHMLVKKENVVFQSYAKVASWFYRNILDVALKDKRYKNLIIVTDGELGHLPFETFLVESPKGQKVSYTKLHYLVKDYSISYNYSATLWKENLTSAKKENNGKMLACASSYEGVDSTLLKMRLPYYYNLRTILNPLPAAESEVDLLADNFKGMFLKGEAANEKYFKNNAENYGVIHLAMHGILHPKVPMLSSLAFTENKDSLEDNFLQAYEVSRLGLNADLVVLSACETGYGKYEQGEGIISLARSFMYAGVSSLVVSLWQVNDYSTGIIMKKFYLNLADGMNKAEALRQAKLFYIDNANETSAHPAFWSPFIQLGNSKSIKLSSSKGDFILWGMGIGIFVLFLIGAFMLKRHSL